MLIFKLLWQPSSEGLSGIKVVQNVKSIRQAVFNLPNSQTISCIGYNVNLQTAVAAIVRGS